MTFVVPFDGSKLARSALARAGAFGEVLDETVLAVAVIPRNNANYAAEQGWIDPDDSYDLEAIVTTLRERVDATAPGATFTYELVDRYAPIGTIKNRIRTQIREADASMVFIGSENAGRMVTALSSVGGGIANSGEYDVVIVRHAGPSKVEALLEASSDSDNED
jgi:nucleotide-binding universal stress UspA family protein